MSLLQTLLGFTIQFGFIACSYLNVRQTSNLLLERLLNTLTLYFSTVIFGSVLLSLIKSFNLYGLITLLGGYMIATWWYRKKSSPSLADTTSNLWEYIALCFCLIITGIVISRSWGILDITHDAVVYVLPRIHLFQQLQSFLYDTYSNIANIWYNQMNFEIVAASWNILTQSIFYSKVANQSFYFWGLLATFLFLQKVGLKKPIALLGVIVVSLMPVNFLIAHTIKNDSALFAAAIASLYYFINFWQKQNKTNFVIFLTSSLICIGIKTTVLPLFFVLGVAIILKHHSTLVNFYNTLKITHLVTLFIIVLCGLHRYIANLIYYGNPLMTVPEESLSISWHNITNGLQSSIASQFTYFTNPNSPVLATEALDNVLGANGGYIFMFLIIIATPGIFFLYKKSSLNKLLISAISFQTLLLIILRPWYPWSTRYITLFFIVILWVSLYTLQVIYNRYRAIAYATGTVITIVVTVQTAGLIHSDHSLWLQDPFTRTNLITRYDATKEAREINPDAKIGIIANANAPIYQYIKPNNIISFIEPQPLTEIISTLEKEQISYLVITNLNFSSLAEVLASNKFSPIHLRNKLSDPNYSSVFKINAF